ncbi:MAG TPA: hypothetical protein VFC39_07115 [Acidobacteriaceae bacterium]|nr:hypothetical protein [Acidobacteriaceae bacterium]
MIAEGLSYECQLREGRRIDASIKREQPSATNGRLCANKEIRYKSFRLSAICSAALRILAESFRSQPPNILTDIPRNINFRFAQKRPYRS